MAAAIRYELGDHHTYEFLEGTVQWERAPGELQDPSVPAFSPHWTDRDIQRSKASFQAIPVSLRIATSHLRRAPLKQSTSSTHTSPPKVPMMASLLSASPPHLSSPL